jgi:hypothetical protein
MPPSQWVRLLQKSSAFRHLLQYQTIIVAPVVVKPEMVSKKASVYDEICHLINKKVMLQTMKYSTR